MTEVYISYNPYRITSEMKINGSPISEESVIFQKMNGKRLQAWIGALPEMLRNERNSREFKVTFHGSTLDYDDVKDSFEQACKSGVINSYETSCEETANDDEVYEKVLAVYDNVKNDNRFTDCLSKDDREGLEAAIRKVQNDIFPIHVIATMSSGKSTLINALLSKKLMPSSNAACTAIITEILDDDGEGFSARVCDDDDTEIKSIEDLTYRKMDRINRREDEFANASKVYVTGNIPFLDVKQTRLKLVDTPGTNNARDQRHREITYKNIDSAAENMILYVLNYTQLATNDDSILLRFVADEIRKGGKETRDRFIFVLNKMDEVKTEDPVAYAINAAVDYLKSYGIEDPQIFPCSAFAALGLRTLLKDIDPYDSDAVDKAADQNQDVDDVAVLVRKINRNDELHLEKYSTLVPSEQEKLRNLLSKDKETDNKKEAALIHSGICSIESAIRAYVHKYARSKKIKDFAEPLEKQLHQTETEFAAKIAALSGGEEAKEIHRRSTAIREMINKGEEAKKYKEKIESIDPISDMKTMSEKLIDEANIQLVRRFETLDEKIEGRKKALAFVNKFSDDAAEVLSNLSAKLETLVEKDIKTTGEELIKAYQEKLEGLDSSIGSNLNFKTSELVEGVLSRLKTTAVDYTPSGKMRAHQEEDIDSVHQDEVETTTVEVVKMKKVKKTVQDGVKKIQTGEERVVVGYHQEKVGTETVKERRKGLLGLFGFKKKVQKDVFQTFEDVEYRPTYEYVPNMKEIIEEIPTVEQEERHNIKYVVPVAELQRKLVLPIRKELDEDVKELLVIAQKCIDQLKKQFVASFDQIDKLIKSKYEELETYTQQENQLEELKKQCEETLEFVRTNLCELDRALNP